MTSLIYLSKKKKIIVSCGIAIVIVIGISIVVNSKGNSEGNSNLAQQAVSVAVLEKRDLSKVVGANGVVVSEDVSKITTSITSNVKELNIQQGDKVQEGDILCVFDDETIKSEISKLEEIIKLSKEADQYQDGVNQRALTNAQEDENRQVDGATTGVSQAENDLDSANNKVSDGEDNIDSIRKKIKGIKKKLKKLRNERDELNANGDTDGATAKQTLIDTAQTEYESLETSYSTAESDLASLRENVKTAERAVESASEVLDSTQASTAQTVQSQVDNINTSKFKTDDSDNETQLEKLKTNLANTVIKAPISGTITYLNIEAGSPALDGVIMKIENTDALKISVKVKEYDILNIKEGMKTTISCDAIPDVTMQGEVSKIYMTPITTSASDSTSSDSSTLEYAAEIKLDEATTDLLIGMNVKTKIVLEENKDVFAVPYEAITVNENYQNVVYVAIDDGSGKYTVKSIPVEKGIETDYYAAISSDELTEGMYIITTPEMVTEGSAVLVQLSEDAGTTQAPAENVEAPGGF
ncbi:MAG: HlyD family secretion protein [Lachnotalea sp.]